MVDDVRRALAASEAQFRELVEKQADGALVVRPDGVIVFANPAAQELFGRPAGQLVGAMFGLPIAPGLTTEVDLHPGQGQSHVAEMRVVEVSWEGQPALLASIRDITQRKWAAEALRLLSEAGTVLAGSLDRCRTAAGVAELAVQHLADWCLLDLLEGAAAERVERLVAGRAGPGPVEALAGRHPLPAGIPPGVARVLQTGTLEVLAVVGEDDLAGLALAEGHKPALRGLGCRSALLVPLVARGRVLGAMTLLSAGQRSYGPQEQALAQDLADRAALAIDNARLYDEAQEALRRRDEFLAMLAHELRNPLAPILNAAQYMRLRGLADPELNKQRVIIERQGQHLARLVDDLLDLSRITHGKIELRREPVDLAAVLTDAVQEVRSQVEDRGHDLAIELDRGPLVVEGDPTRLAQVVANLLSNADRYTPPGGRIELAGCREGDEVVLRVRDSGRGIPAEMLGKVFETFLQVDAGLDRTLGGLGIGLALVRRLVEMHGGRVTAHSDGEGKGSTFEVRLPRTRQRAAEAVPDGPARVTPRRILLVEDSEDGREMLGALLRLAGHEVQGVGDGAAGLQWMRRELPDVALVDIGLPELDGYALARAVRALPGGERVLLLAVTGYGQPEDRAKALAAGFDDHLVKPVDLEGLSRVLETRGGKKTP